MSNFIEQLSTLMTDEHCRLAERHLKEAFKPLEIRGVHKINDIRLFSREALASDRSKLDAFAISGVMAYLLPFVDNSEIKMFPAVLAGGIWYIESGFGDAGNGILCMAYDKNKNYWLALSVYNGSLFLDQLAARADEVPGGFSDIRWKKDY